MTTLNILIGAIAAGIFSLVGVYIGYRFSLKAEMQVRRRDAFQNLYLFARKLKIAVDKNNMELNSIFKKAMDESYDKIFSNIFYYEDKDIENHLAHFEELYSQVDPSMFALMLNGENIKQTFDDFYNIVKKKIETVNDLQLCPKDFMSQKE
jgi:hypothetical protein